MHVFQRAALIEAAEAIGVEGLQPHELRHPATMTLDPHATARPAIREAQMCSPDRIRTGATALRGRRPGPLDDGARKSTRAWRWGTRTRT
jgi:hypothetical protein